MELETPDQTPPSEGRRPMKVGKALANPKRMTLTVNGDTHTLSDLTWRLLIILIERAPNSVSYEDIARFVWNQEYVSDETVAQRVRQLRRVLGDDSKAPTYIRTVRGVGYQLIADVTPASDEISETSLSLNRSSRKGATVVKRAASVLGLSVTLGFLIIIGIKTVNTGTPNLSSPISSEASVEELVTRAYEYRERGQKSANDTAIILYEKALALAPNNTQALIGLSYALSHKSSKFGEAQTWADEAARVADLAILNAPISNNKTRGNAFAARGMADDARGRVSSALSYYQKSLALDPRNASSQSSAAYLLQMQGHYSAALVQEMQAREYAAPTYFSDYQISMALAQVGLDRAAGPWLKRARLLRPDTPFLATYIAKSKIKNGHINEALDHLIQTPDLQSDGFTLMSIAHVLSQDKEKAIEALNTATALARRKARDCYTCLALTHHLGVNKEQADPTSSLHKVLDASAAAIESGDEWPYYRVELAYLHLGVGAREKALLSLQEAYALGYRDWAWLQITPLLQDIHNDPEFIALVKRMKSALTAEREKINADPRLSLLFQN